MMPERTSSAMVVMTLSLSQLFLAGGCGGDEGVGDPVEDHSAYTIDSAFDVSGDFGDSTLGSLLNMLRDMSDGEDDPGRFVVEQLIDALPAPVSWAAEPLESTLGRQANEAIYALMPTAADEIKAIASALSSAARKFEISSRLDVGIDAKGRFTGTHQLQQVVYAFAAQTMKLDRAELGDRVPPAVRIPVHIEGKSLTVDGHLLRLPTGTLLQKALDRVIIPAVVKEAASIVEVITRWFACAVIAAKIADTLDAGESVVLGACVSGASKVADQLTQKLAQLDQHGGLRLNTLTEAGADGSTYEGGWRGAYVVGEDTAAPLDPKRCPFTATRVSGPSQ